MAFVLAIVCSTTIVRAEELTVADGVSTSAYLPVYGAFVDDYIHTQVIYPATLLSGLNGKDLTGMKFYLSFPASKLWTGAEFEIGFAEVAEDGFGSSSSIAAFLSATVKVVFEGALDARSDVMEITFTDAYTYKGGNLLFDLKSTKTGSEYASCTFVGDWDMDNPYLSITGSSALSADDAAPNSSRNSKFLPKTTFEYIDGGSSSCEKPSDLTVTSVSANEASLNWSNPAGFENVQYALVAQGEELVWSEVMNIANVSFDDLKPETNYTFNVRTYCDAENHSAIVSVKFETEKSCYAPRELKASNIGSNSANLGWIASEKANESGYEYVVVEKGETPDWSKAKEDNSGFVLVSGLKPLVAYDAYVRSICGTDDVSESAMTTFTTICGAISLPLEENFDKVSNNELPSCWERLSDTSTPHVYDKQLFFNVATPGSSQIAVFPTFDAMIADLSITLEYTTRAYGETYNGFLEVGYMTNSEDAETFVALSTKYGISSGKTEVALSLSEAPTEATRLALRASAPEETYGVVLVDNITVVVTPACPSPKDLVCTKLTHESATFEWKQGEDENVYQYAVVPENADLAITDWKQTEPDVRKATVSGLTAGVTYEFVLRSDCGSGKTGQEFRLPFTPKCDAPQNLEASVSSDNTATISWTDAEGTAWTIKVEHDGDVMYFNQYLVDGTTVILSYLASDADYSVQVARIEPCESDFTSIVSFHSYCGTNDVSELPLKEDFESIPVNTLPSCWLSREYGGYPTVVSGSAAFGADEWTDGKCVAFLGNAEEILILPKFDVPVKDLILKLRYRNSGNAVSVGYLEALDKPFQPVQELEETNYSDEEPTAIKFNEIAFDGKGYVAIYYSSGDYYGRAYVDNIELDLNKEVPTSVDSVEANKTTTKRIENGQLIIIREGVKYNAVGSVVK